MHQFLITLNRFDCLRGDLKEVTHPTYFAYVMVKRVNEE